VVLVAVLAVGGLSLFNVDLAPAAGGRPLASGVAFSAGSAGPPASFVWFNETGLPPGTNWSVSMNNGDHNSSTGPSIGFLESDHNWYYYTIGSIYAYQTPPPGWIYVEDTNQTVPVPWSPTNYPVQFAETGLPAFTSWSVNFSGNLNSSSSSTIEFTSGNGTFGFTIDGVPGYVAVPSSGSVTVNGGGATEPIVFSPATYAVNFTESGLPADTDWSVTFNGVFDSSSTPTIVIASANGTFDYTIGAVAGYLPTPSNGSVTVNGGPVTQLVNWVLNSFLVTFTEGGLPIGTTWYLNVSGEPTVISITTTASIALADGSYSYAIASADKRYAPATASGEFTVVGGDLPESVAFSLVLFPVTFSETGLSGGRVWYVNVSGPMWMNSSSTSTTATFSLANGTYSYSVASANKQFAPSPAGGQFVVVGKALPESVSFSLVVYSVTFTETGLPSGSKWYLNVSKEGPVASIVTTASIWLANGTYSFSIASANKKFTPSPASGLFKVTGNASPQSVVFARELYSVTFTETGLPMGSEWYVNVSGPVWVNSTSVSTTDQLSLENGSYSFSVASGDPQYAPSPNAGNVDVSGTAVPESVTFNRIVYLVTFNETGLPAGSEWYLNVSGQPSVESTLAAASISLVNGTYSYSVASSDHELTPSTPTGEITVHGSDLSELVNFTSQPYSIHFVSNGLPTGTMWWVNLENLFNLTNTTHVTQNRTTISFAEANGNYSFEVKSQAGFTPSPKSGNLTVRGNIVTIPVYWTPVPPVNYAVSFNPTGLLPGTAWGVRLDGDLTTNGFGSIVFAEPNGTHTFALFPLSGYSGTPSSGSVNVSGRPVSVSITWSQLHPVVFTEIGLPVATDWALTFDGNSYTPTGASLTLSVTDGSYPFSVTATGSYVSSPSSGMVNVSGQPVALTLSFDKSPTTFQTLAKELPYVILGIVVLLAVIALAVWLRRRRAPVPPTPNAPC
jgi:hypothetical protein